MVGPRSLSVVLVSIFSYQMYAYYFGDPSSQIVHPHALKSAPYKIYAIGDCHGDLPNTLKILQMAKLIDLQNNWIAEDSTLVQTGDIVDRGPDTIALYKLFRTLAEQAEQVGGRVISLLGNHEVMNMMGDLRYVDPKDVLSFGDRGKRAREWSKNGALGQYLRTLNVTTMVHGSVFVHGGIAPEYADIERINREAARMLDLDVIPMDTLLIGPSCPLWLRVYAQDDESKACPMLRKTLEILGAKRMIIGHTPQSNGMILARCNMSLGSSDVFEPRVYVIDVGISAAYGSVAQGLLEIEGIEDIEVVRGVYYEGIKILS